MFKKLKKSLAIIIILTIIAITPAANAATTYPTVDPCITCSITVPLFDYPTINPCA